jgi:hypothetical protein
MTPADFLNEVVIPNVAASGENVGDLRLAVNAILTLDALVGIIHADRYKQRLETADDDTCFRNRLAERHEEYGLIRDTASALKHGELRRKKPRLVRRAEQVTSHSGAWDQAAWDRSAWDTLAVVWIEADDPVNSRRADEVTRAVLGILQGMV